MVTKGRRKPAKKRAARKAPEAAVLEQLATLGAGDEDVKAIALDTIRRLRLELDQLDKTKRATPRQRKEIMVAMTGATKLLAKLTGSVDVTAAQILRAPAWRDVKAVIVNGLAQVPGALEALAKALGTLEPG